MEIFVAEVSDRPEDDQIYRLTYDGSVADEHGFAVMGGAVEKVSEYLTRNYRDGLDLDEAIRVAVDALGQGGDEPRQLSAGELEVAVLDRSRSQQRKFKRIPEQRLAELFGSTGREPGRGEQPDEVKRQTADQ